MANDLLVAEGVTLRFGGVAALSEVSFSVREGEIFGIIGPNGAGKSSLINVLTGTYRATSGSVRLEGQGLTGERPAEIARRGVVRTFQNLGLFDRMTVLENVMVGRHVRMHGGIVASALRLPGLRRHEAEARQHCRALLGLLELAHVRDTLVGQLPYGVKKRVEFAKALAAEPRCILLDEPVAGMNEEESSRVAEIIGRTRSEFGATVVLIEHNIELVMGLTDRVMVLDFGKRIALGTPDEVRRTPEVIAAYIGEHVEHPGAAAPGGDPGLTPAAPGRPSDDTRLGAQGGAR